MRCDENKKWTKKEIATEYKKENESWGWEKCYEEACIIYKELNKLNRDSFKNQDRFYKNNTPFSFYESEDGTWSSISSLSEI